jgi:membrane-bound lytic murein transglycosylase D
MYRVGAGDTLVAIAKQFAIDVEDIARDNKIDSGDALKAGQLLKLRVRKDAIEKASTAPPASDAKDDEPKSAPKDKETARGSHHDKGEQREKAEPSDPQGGDKSTGARGRNEKKKARRKKS